MNDEQMTGPGCEPVDFDLSAQTMESRGWLTAPATLLFRPATFFRERAHRVGLGPLLLMAWLIGIQRLDDSASTRALQTGGGTQFTWQSYFIFLAIVGMFTGLIVYGILGWWFRVRLIFCGVRKPGGRPARAIYLISGLIITVPMLGLLGWEAATYDTPWDAWQSDDALSIIFAVLGVTAVGWSIIASWRGVRGAFPSAKPVASAIWFLVLPIITIGLLAGAVVAASFASGFSEPPDVRRPGQFRSPGFSFSHPANWTINTENAVHDRNFFLDIREPNGGYLSLNISWLNVPVAHALEERWQDTTGLAVRSPIRRLGPFDGSGFMSDAEEGWQWEMLIAPLADDYALEIIYVVPAHAAEIAEPGRDMILKSLRAVPLSHQQPDLEEPGVVALGPALVRFPGNWTMSRDEGVLEIWTDHAGFWLITYPFDLSLEEEVRVSAVNDMDSDAFELEFEEIDAWGPLQGYGRKYEREEDGVAVTRLYFAGMHGDDTVVEIGLSMDRAHMSRTLEGMNFIRDRMLLEAPDENTDESSEPPPQPDP